MKRIRGTWKGNMIALLICAAFFGVFALLAAMGDIPAYDELTETAGRLANVEHCIRRSAMGPDSEWWEITLEDGSVFKADDVIRFDAEHFIGRVQPGDVLTVLAEPDGKGWNTPCEIRLGGEVVHSYEASVEGMRENQKTAFVLPLIPLLCAALVWPVEMMRRGIKKRGQK